MGSDASLNGHQPGERVHLSTAHTLRPVTPGPLRFLRDFSAVAAYLRRSTPAHDTFVLAIPELLDRIRHDRARGSVELELAADVERFLAYCAGVADTLVAARSLDLPPASLVRAITLLAGAFDRANIQTLETELQQGHAQGDQDLDGLFRAFLKPHGMPA